MTRWGWILIGSTTLACLCLFGWYHLLTSRIIAPGVQLIQPRFSSMGANMIVSDHPSGRIVVDSQLPVLSRLTSLHAEPLNKGEHLIVTHWHPDHSGGIVALAGDGTVWAHRKTVDRLAKPQIGKHLTAPGSEHTFAAIEERSLPTPWTGRAISGVTILEFRAAHTDVDFAVHLPHANVIAVGDLVWPNAFPFVDIHSGGSVTGLITALDELIKLANDSTKIVPGHGQPISKSTLVNYRTMVVDSAHSQICEGGSVSLDEWQHWSSDLVPMSRWAEIVRSNSETSCSKLDGEYE